jgi:hypothetical protein
MFFEMPFTFSPHFLAALSAVSTASAPVFMGSAMSYPLLAFQLRINIKMDSDHTLLALKV